MSDVRATRTVEEVAKILGVGRNTAYGAVRSGAIPSIRVGKRYVIPLQVIDKMLLEGWDSGE